MDKFLFNDQSHCANYPLNDLVQYYYCKIGIRASFHRCKPFYRRTDIRIAKGGTRSREMRRSQLTIIHFFGHRTDYRQLREEVHVAWNTSPDETVRNLRLKASPINTFHMFWIILAISSAAAQVSCYTYSRRSALHIQLYIFTLVSESIGGIPQRAALYLVTCRL